MSTVQETPVPVEETTPVKEATPVPQEPTPQKADEPSTKSEESTPAVVEDNHVEIALEDAPRVEEKEAAAAAAPAPVAAEPEPKASWKKLPRELDGWVVSHNAIRHDMDQFAKALDALAVHAENDKLGAWMGPFLTEWFASMYKWIVHHHDNEEKIVFPEMNKRCDLPAKMSDDHHTLMANLDAVRDKNAELCDKLTNSAPASEVAALVTELKQLTMTMSEGMREHLLEEEVVALPMLRANFELKEYKVMEKKILAGTTELDLAHVLIAFDDDKKREWMKKVAKIPGPIIKFKLWKVVKTGGVYSQKFTRKIDSVIKGEEIPEEKLRSSCVIS